MLSGDLAELGGETVNPCTSNVDTFGRAERLTIIGGQNVGRGIDGIVCFGALRGGVGPSAKRRGLGGLRRRMCYECNECRSEKGPRARSARSLPWNKEIETKRKHYHNLEEKKEPVVGVHENIDPANDVRCQASHDVINLNAQAQAPILRSM